ncbi:hypothetical protein HPB48_020739 [Haemaphysalis longicornis]|uniref:Uncharacterized protein n=1 Tax=Haemaphysalis longicornis TaxID=44386 RepID=A0A9J6G7M2_HAELO|nr:hypothetical protein HPB48_020739 [Haemaphysalis longicornis]
MSNIAAQINHWVLPGVLFLGALAILLLHYGVVSPVIAKTGWLVHTVFGITSCEAIVALANTFFGMAGPFLISPCHNSGGPSLSREKQCTGEF